jgi:hypothetical protein
LISRVLKIRDGVCNQFYEEFHHVDDEANESSPEINLLLRPRHVEVENCTIQNETFSSRHAFGISCDWNVILGYMYLGLIEIGRIQERVHFLGSGKAPKGQHIYVIAFGKNSVLCSLKQLLVLHILKLQRKTRSTGERSTGKQ